MMMKKEWSGKDPVAGIIVVVGNVITCGKDSRRNMAGGSLLLCSPGKSKDI